MAGVGRKTRSGAEFSPWLGLGVPITAPKGYSVAQVLKQADAMCLAAEDSGYESTDERDVDDSTSLPPSQFQSFPQALASSPRESLSPQPSSSSAVAQRGKPRNTLDKDPRPRHRNTPHAKAGKKARQKRK
jgi:hypothetical protein